MFSLLLPSAVGFVLGFYANFLIFKTQVDDMGKAIAELRATTSDNKKDNADQSKNYNGLNTRVTVLEHTVYKIN